MIFENALNAVKGREAIAKRSDWDDDKFIFCQVPVTIKEEIIPKMQSLPDVVKHEILEAGYIKISYVDQMCIFNCGIITYYIPSSEDIFADDWEVKINDIDAEYEN